MALRSSPREEVPWHLPKGRSRVNSEDFLPDLLQTAFDLESICSNSSYQFFDKNETQDVPPAEEGAFEETSLGI